MVVISAWPEVDLNGAGIGYGAGFLPSCFGIVPRPLHFGLGHRFAGFDLDRFTLRAGGVSSRRFTTSSRGIVVLVGGLIGNGLGICELFF